MRRGRFSGGSILAILLLFVFVGGVLLYRSPRATPLREMLRSVKDTSQDAATTSKVKTALLLSKNVSAFDIKTVQIRSQDGTVILSGSVPSRAEKLLAERVAQAVEGVKKVVNNLNTQEPAAG